MARKAGGADQLAAARGLLRTAKTADELRTAQAVVLPLELGLSLEQTATAIGRSERRARCVCAIASWRDANGRRRGPSERCATAPMRHWNAKRRFSTKSLRARCAGGRRRSAAQGERRGTPGQAGGAVDNLSHARAQRLAQAGPGHGPRARRRRGP